MLIPVPPSDCDRAREDVSRRLDDELTELESARLDAHLRRCAACREFERRATAIVAELRRAALERPSVAVFEPRRRRRPAALPVRPAAAAALALVAVAGSFALGRVVGQGGGAPEASVSTAPLVLPARNAVEQHLLALLPRSIDAQSLRAGNAVAL